MITRAQEQAARARAVEYLRRAHIAITPEEARRIEVADLGLGELEVIGVQILVYVNTDMRSCCSQAASTPCRPIPGIGSRPGSKGRWCPSFPRAAATSWTCSPTRRYGGRPL